MGSEYDDWIIIFVVVATMLVLRFKEYKTRNILKALLFSHGNF